MRRCKAELRLPCETRLHSLGACGTTEVVPFPGVALPNPQRDGAVESHVSQKKRDPSTPLRAGYGAPTFALLAANSGFLTGLSARFGMTRFYGGGIQNVPRGVKLAAFLVSVDAGLEGLLHPRFLGLAARLKSCPSRAWRFPNLQRDGVVESHVSQRTRDMGHPGLWWRRLTAGFLSPLRGWVIVSCFLPTACAPSASSGQAVGCILSPLRGWVLFVVRLAARLKLCPSRSWRFPNLQRVGPWNPTLRLRSGQAPSQSARRMGHPRSI